LERLLGRGAEGIVLDLRGNGGGLLREAVLVASLFIEDGTIVSTRGRTKPKREFEAEGEAIPAEVPVVVLVDGGSASASEIVTGALRDRHRATVVGERTFGKGVFQEVQPLSNGGVLDLTVGSYYLPGGENISDKGIKPTVRARDRQATERDEALPVALDVLLRKVR
jgi:carboxyl-terminal processing protease